MLISSSSSCNFVGGFQEVRQLRIAHYNTWSPTIRQAVDNQSVVRGMSREQVQAATKLADRWITKRVVEEDGQSVEKWFLWSYHGLGGKAWTADSNRPAAFSKQLTVVSFRNGVVVGID